MCRAAQNSDASPSLVSLNRRIVRFNNRVPRYRLPWHAKYPNAMQPAKTRSLDNVDEHLHT